MSKAHQCPNMRALVLLDDGEYGFKEGEEEEKNDDDDDENIEMEAAHAPLLGSHPVVIKHPKGNILNK
ncbi:unnamed protein product [Linum trigynum]|uniref:Uncharacterized protein n=1 Tax=Linum trigynum TaxID=586398 RepID=A0AAV2EVG8_9ROSI